MMKTKTSMLALVSLMGICLSACNTTSGVGKDLKSAGREIEKAADKTK